MAKRTRKIVRIDEDKCNGCGQCVSACAEGAIALIDGKARLVSETYCDGLGACLGECPQGAIAIEDRPADAFDEQAVHQHLQAQKAGAAKPADGRTPVPLHVMPHEHAGHAGGCPGSALRSFQPGAKAPAADPSAPPPSALGQWPVQLMLVPPTAPFLRGADILICADCVPFAVADFHKRYLAGRAVLVGCPKLDDIEHYHRKLREIFAVASPASITILRMEVPCCGALAHAVVEARDASAPQVPVEVHTVGIREGIGRQVVPPQAAPSARR